MGGLGLLEPSDFQDARGLPLGRPVRRGGVVQSTSAASAVGRSVGCVGGIESGAKLLCLVSSSSKELVSDGRGSLFDRLETFQINPDGSTAMLRGQENGEVLKYS